MPTISGKEVGWREVWLSLARLQTPFLMLSVQGHIVLPQKTTRGMVVMSHFCDALSDFGIRCQLDDHNNVPSYDLP